MGVNAIVIVENPHKLSVPVFGERLEADPWGRRAAHRYDGRLNWAAFDWEGRPYLSWLSAPRWRYLGLDYLGDAEEEDAQRDWLRPDLANSVQITFLKVMLAVERITGGTIYVGLDVLGARLPEDADQMNEDFWLPPRLDDWLDEWRSVDDYEPTDPGLVY